MYKLYVKYLMYVFTYLIERMYNGYWTVGNLVTWSFANYVIK